MLDFDYILRPCKAQVLENDYQQACYVLLE